MFSKQCIGSLELSLQSLTRPLLMSDISPGSFHQGWSRNDENTRKLESIDMESNLPDHGFQHHFTLGLIEGKAWLSLKEAGLACLA